MVAKRLKRVFLDPGHAGVVISRNRCLGVGSENGWETFKDHFSDPFLDPFFEGLVMPRVFFSHSGHFWEKGSEKGAKMTTF